MDGLVHLLFPVYNMHMKVLHSDLAHESTLRSTGNAGHALDGAWPTLSEEICRALITQEDAAHRSLKWMTFLDLSGQNLLMQCCTDSLHDVDASMQQLNLSEKAKSHVLMLRGLLAFKLLLHCLQKRHNVDYGITDR